MKHIDYMCTSFKTAFWIGTPAGSTNFWVDSAPHFLDDIASKQQHSLYITELYKVGCNNVI